MKVINFTILQRKKKLVKLQVVEKVFFQHHVHTQTQSQIQYTFFSKLQKIKKQIKA
jgi:hypothetical protein